MFRAVFSEIPSKTALETFAFCPLSFPSLFSASFCPSPMPFSDSFLEGIS